ncbi:MAG: hypothetical protein ACXWUD_14110 [Methylosarcina sp.]
MSAAKARLGARAAQVKWLEADVLEAELFKHGYDVRYDQAVFHFLISAEERQAYVFSRST